MKNQSAVPFAPTMDCTELFIDELDNRHEFDALPITLAAGINFGCNGGICEQTVCPIPPA